MDNVCALAIGEPKADWLATMGMNTGKPQLMTMCPSGPIKGVATIPGDKSISHRAVILGALAVGETRISGLLEGEDVLATIRAVRQFGACAEKLNSGDWSIYGAGTGGFAEPDDIIDCGNAGTGVRLLMGAMATTPIHAVFTGDHSLRSRPMRRITDPLQAFGAKCRFRQGGFLPVSIAGANDPIPVNCELTAPSAQVKSAILFAGLNAPGQTVIAEKFATRDHSERMLKAFGARLSVDHDGRRDVITLDGYAELQPQNLVVPADPSSAAFPAAAAAIVEGSDLLITGVGVNPTRIGFYNTLEEMGADIEFANRRAEGGEPVADLRIRHSPLRGVEVPPERAPTMIDEYPVLAAVASFAEGETVMRGIRELRIKESDRIAAMSEGLAACGVATREDQGELTVIGNGTGNVKGGATCRSFFDHRIAMSFACLGLGSRNPVSIDDATPISTSFPGFMELMAGIGALIGLEPTKDVGQS